MTDISKEAVAKVVAALGDPAEHGRKETYSERVARRNRSRASAADMLTALRAEVTRLTAALVAAEADNVRAVDEIEAQARRYANIYDPGTDGRNSFTLFADWLARIRARSADGGV